MPYTSHGHPYGLVLIGDTPPRLIARCGGPAICGTCSTEAHSPSPLNADSAAALVALGWTPPAPAAEPTEAQKYAESIIRSARQFDHGAYLERLPGMEDLTDAAFDALCEEVYQALKSATVTVTWPQDTEQAGDAR